MNHFKIPNWEPKSEPGMRILVIGASGGIGHALIDMLLNSSDCIIGAHGSTKGYKTNRSNVIPLSQEFNSEGDCINVVKKFVSIAGGIDALVVLSGGIKFSGHWRDMPEQDWEHDISINLNQPFYLARTAMQYMKNQGNGGRIILNGTESALHGGSPQSFPYAIAKRGTECMVQGLAREGAESDILVNGTRFGYIKSGFHQRWHDKTSSDMKSRADLVLLKRGGDPKEAAALIVYLLSGWSRFITGQMIPLTGGDWL